MKNEDNQNEDMQNLISQYNNFSYPKPVNDIDIEIISKKKIPYADPNFSWHILWPEQEYKREKLNILVAGCGSDQAAIIAKCNPLHKVIGVDISSKSIEYHNYLKKKHNINNLQLHCNDFRKLKFKEKFDYIISTGVIHHLIDPNTALIFFNKNLKENGVINLMVYGDKKSQTLNEVKKIFKTLDLKQDKKSIDIAKNTILNLHNKHPAKTFSQSPDLNYDAGIVDLLLHKQEKFFNSSELIDILEKNGLIIKNFFDGKISSLTKFFINDIDNIDKIRKLNKKTQLELGQILNWDDRIIELVVSKKSQLNKSLFYNTIDILDCYIYPNRSIKYNINGNFFEIHELYSGAKFSFDISIAKNIDWALVFSGKYKLKEIIIDQNIEAKNFIKNFFYLLFENKHLDISFKEIKNYLDFLAK